MKQQKSGKSRAASALVPGRLEAAAPGATSVVSGRRADILQMSPLLVVVGVVGTPESDCGGIVFEGTMLPRILSDKTKS